MQYIIDFILDNQPYSACACIAGIIVVLIIGTTKQKRLQKYHSITIGMEEKKMLSIMGGGYSKSLLKDGQIKYEWRLNAYSKWKFSKREYSEKKSVIIYTQNGLVNQVLVNNL